MAEISIEGGKLGQQKNSYHKYGDKKSRMKDHPAGIC